MLARQSVELSERIDTFGAAGLRSGWRRLQHRLPKQIQEILFEKLQLPVISKTPKGQPSTSESVLRNLLNNTSYQN
ncbi:MAG: hypothetical protein Ct9H300mP14_03180 [Gammaproteobacteria bacterium]|nr:MAG: hypothetical protein Ct9H300mP14_03180 [Gammaproteobacteria bacterium]